MVDIDDGSTLGPTFRRAADMYGPRELLAMAPDAQRHYHRGGYSITYTQARDEVARLTQLYASRGYGGKHPVHLRHDGTAQGMCAVPWIRTGGGAGLRDPRRPGHHSNGAGAALQPAAAVPCQRVGPVLCVRVAHGQLPGPGRAV